MNICGGRGACRVQSRHPIVPPFSENFVALGKAHGVTLRSRVSLGLPGTLSNRRQPLDRPTTSSMDVHRVENLSLDPTVESTELIDPPWAVLDSMNEILA
jgi:hypothetical protein